MPSSGNFCTINPVGAQGKGTVQTGTLGNGNLSVAIDEVCFGSVGVTSGKWYWEWALTGSSDSGMAVGWANQQVNSSIELGYNSPSSATGAQIVYMYVSPSSGAWDIISDAPKGASSGSDSDKTGTVVQNDIISLAADFDNDKWYFGINGSYTAIRSGQNPSNGSNPMCSASGGGGTVTISRTAGFTWFPAFGNWAASTRDVKVNFGQDSTFSGSFSAGGNADENGFGDFKYAVPTGFLAMCSANLPTSSDIDPGGDNGADENPTKQFNVITFTGTGSARTISGLGLQPDLIWAKRRDGSRRHYLVDSNRGFTKYLHSEDTYSEGTSSDGVTSANSDGFVIGGSLDYINASSNTYVAWCWRANGGTTVSNSEGSITATVQANTKAGFSIATYQSPNSGTNHTVGHGLSGVDFIITKNRDQSFNWYCFHKSSPNYTYRLNSGSRHSYSNWSMGATTWGSEEGYTTNGSQNWVAYCWQNVFGMQHFGSYVGNGNTDGPFVYTGFRPRLIFTLLDNSTSGWRVRDTARSTFNPTDKIVWWNREDQEYSTSGYNFDIFSNGFKVTNTGSDFNTSGSTYFYGAWADVPAKYNNTF